MYKTAMARIAQLEDMGKVKDKMLSEQLRVNDALATDLDVTANALITMRDANEVHRKGYYAYKEADENKGKSIAILKATIRELIKED